jgi:hypothetical protein
MHTNTNKWTHFEKHTHMSTHAIVPTTHPSHFTHLHTETHASTNALISYLTWTHTHTHTHQHTYTHRTNKHTERPLPPAQETSLTTTQGTCFLSHWRATIVSSFTHCKPVCKQSAYSPGNCCLLQLASNQLPFHRDEPKAVNLKSTLILEVTEENNRNRLRGNGEIICTLFLD